MIEGPVLNLASRSTSETPITDMGISSFSPICRYCQTFEYLGERFLFEVLEANLGSSKYATQLFVRAPESFSSDYYVIDEMQIPSRPLLLQADSHLVCFCCW